MEEKEYLTRKDVMKLLQISYSHCDRLFRLKDFPKIQLGGKAIVSKADLEAYLKKYKGSQIPIKATGD
jgi:predicted DNA-binding transcriptional regulator AlpA